MSSGLKQGGKYAIIAGICGAAGSFFGKMSGEFNGYELKDAWILNVTCFSLMILCNSAVWIFFAKALQALDSSLRATLITSTINFLISALLGIVVFKEQNKLLWMCGIVMLIIGLLLIQQNKLKIKNH